MSDLNEKNPHPSARKNNSDKPQFAERNKPRSHGASYHDDEDFADLEQRFSDHAKNKYYAKVSTGYRNVKLLLVILLTAVIAFALVLGADNFTYSNLRYLLRNFGEASSGDAERAERIEFHGADGCALGIYGGKLAVAGGDNVSLFRASGKKIYEIGAELSEPVLTCGGKYFFVWKCGDNGISVYNSVSRVGALTADGPIYAVSADEEGRFAVMYKDRVYNSAVAVYNSDLEKIATKNMPNDTAVDIALSPEGGILYALSFSVADGDYLAKLDISDINSGTVAHTYTYSGELPLKVGSFDGGGCYAVTDRSVYVYSPEGELVFAETCENTVYCIFQNEEYVCTVSSVNGNAGMVKAISKNGEVAASVVIDGAVLEGCITDDGLFLLSSSVVLVSLEDAGKQLISRSPNAVGLLCDGNAVYCVYTGRADLIFCDGKPVNSSSNAESSANN